MTPQELRKTIGSGLLSFPVTDFTEDGVFNPQGYADRLHWLAPYGASALFAAGGTGEFFSLGLEEYTRIVDTAVQACEGQVPILAGAGGPLPFALAEAKAAQNVGAQGLLLLPHYLTEASQEGLIHYVSQVCHSVDIGVVVYNRNVCRLSADSLQKLADMCPNLIGFKDGVGEIEPMVNIRRRLGDRFSYLGGLPTAEVYAAAYKAMGVPVYSSAVFNFIPKTAMRFYRAVCENDQETIGSLLDSFFLPMLEIRNRCPGYAVSLVKAGAKIAGRDAGPVRAPLTDLTSEEMKMLEALIDTLDES